MGEQGSERAPVVHWGEQCAAAKTPTARPVGLGPCVSRVSNSGRRRRLEQAAGGSGKVALRPAAGDGEQEEETRFPHSRGVAFKDCRCAS